MKPIVPFLALLFASHLVAHPMGNFSVNHYAKLVVTQRGVELTYALDLAEIPTFELLREWNLDRNAPPPELQSKAQAQAREWLKNLTITVDGRPETPRLEQVKLVIADGAGNLPIMRITSLARVSGSGGKLAYEDTNFPERAGWKEIVMDAGPGVVLRKASQSNADVSQALTHYPPDPTTAPPQDLRAEAEWKLNQAPVIARVPVVVPIPQPKIAPAATAPALMTKQAAPAGTVVRGDFLSKLMKQRQLTTWMLIVAMGAAFLLGAAHALTPGHGKTIVAAYLVGSRGTLKHAVFLGAMVTFTHTITVFALGLATLFLFRYIMPEKITQVLGAVSGLSIVAIGAWMLWKRARNAGHSHGHQHHHDHVHPHGHEHHDHVHPHEHPHAHHHHHDHDHHHGHSHVPESMSWTALAALGASGGLVPCESALVLLLGAIALGRVGLGLALLVCFSLGLALVLMGIGVLILYAKNLIPERKRDSSRGWLRWVSIASPAVVIVLGLIMTGVSLGWIRPEWGIG